MDRGHTVLVAADEFLHIILEVLLLRHELDVLEVEGNGTSQEAVDEFPIKLVVM